MRAIPRREEFSGHASPIGLVPQIYRVPLKSTLPALSVVEKSRRSGQLLLSYRDSMDLTDWIVAKSCRANTLVVQIGTFFGRFTWH